MTSPVDIYAEDELTNLLIRHGEKVYLFTSSERPQERPFDILSGPDNTKLMRQIQMALLSTCELLICKQVNNSYVAYKASIINAKTSPFQGYRLSPMSPAETERLLQEVE